MANGLQPQVVDIPLLLPNQTPPKHAGPLGRLGSMLNAQIKHFLPSSQTQPQKVVVEPRDGFTALTTECRDATTGAIVTGDWNNPELLAPLGNQLLSVCDSIPRVNNGASWTYYGAQRLLTQQLSEDIFHTTNHTLQASDSAYLGGVTCVVWTETSQNGPIILQTVMIGFRGDDGAWIRTPSQIYQNNNGNALGKVVQDGTYFWVVFSTTTKIAINVFDTHGVLVASDATTIPQRWTPSPGYWDIGAFVNGGTHYVAIAQPHAFSAVGADVTIDISTCTVAGSVITIGTVNNAVVLCNGPIAYGANDSGSGLPYVVTASNGNRLNGYTLNHVGTISQVYLFGAVLAGSGIPDALTGWVDGAQTAHAAYSLLSNFATGGIGPTNDPGLRYTRSYACTNLAVVTLTNHVNGVLLSSRAFKVDGDWYAATYYQSGQGNGPSSAPLNITPANPTDYFTGAANQPVLLSSGDFATGAAQSMGNGLVQPTSFVASITHAAGDNVVVSSAPDTRWNFSTAAFVGTGTSPFGPSTVAFPSNAGALLHISGAANAANNGDWFITFVAGATQLVTEDVSLQGNRAINETFGGGVTASITQVWAFVVPTDNVNAAAFGNTVPFPPLTMWDKFTGGTITVAGASGASAAANGTYSMFRAYLNKAWNGLGNYDHDFLFLATKTSGAAGAGGAYYLYGTISGGVTGATATFAPLVPNDWCLFGLANSFDTRAGIGISLGVTGALNAGNNGSFAETASSTAYNRIGDITGGQPAQRAETFVTYTTDAAPAPKISRNLTDPAQVMLLHIAGTTFDPSFLNATVVMTGMIHAEDNNRSYQITELATWVDTHTVRLSPIDGNTGQTIYNFRGTETVVITKDATAGSPAYQPCWYLTPLSLNQAVAGRFEWSIAYADWRFDGAAVAGGTFERNGYPCALSSVVAGPTGKQLALPYRAQSFTAGQTVTNNTGGVIGVQSTQQSTVGLKLFTLATATGQASVNSGEMFVPGPQASAFSASGFTEHGINLGPEKPFIVSQGVSANALALTVKATCFYAIAFECVSESGDRIWSVTSPVLPVTLTGSNNKVTIGGRMPGPTLRVVGVAIYRTANTGNPPTSTIQHYKITNDLAVNGPGFTFSSVNGGATNDTWQFVDEIPDKSILSAQTLYTDQGFLQRFPAPAHRQSVGSWQNRTWVIGYDGAVWMSGEKEEGDDVWFHPVFRYVLPTDDKPVALAAMENYLLVFCSRSIWFIPAVQFPDATGANGTLPTPQPLPFRNGCTGFAVTVKAGVVYSSTAGGVWLINRALTNLYLSQPLQDSLKLGITGMTVDGAQRLMVTTGTNDIFVFDELSQAWLDWFIGGSPSQLVTTWQGNAVYEDAARVRGQVPGTFADITDGVSVGVSPTLELALVSLGTVKGQKTVWAINLTGQVLGPCQIWAQLTYPDDAATVSSYGPFAVTAGVLNVEINPMIEEATSFDLLIFATFIGVPTPAGSYSLELITAECGIEPTMSKRPNAQRIPGS